MYVEGRVLQYANDNCVLVESYMNHTDNFSNDALNVLGKISHNSNGTTISNHVSVTKIHYCFYGKWTKYKLELESQGKTILKMILV